MSLIEDSKAARKLGMTYGEYMACSNRPRSSRAKKKTGNGLVCTICGAPLYGQQRKYCSVCELKYGVSL